VVDGCRRSDGRSGLGAGEQLAETAPSAPAAPGNRGLWSNDVALVEHDHPSASCSVEYRLAIRIVVAISQDLLEGVMDRVLGARIDRRGGIVKHQHPRVGQRRSGQRDALTLPAGQG